MTAVLVVADNDRVTGAETQTGWSSIGGGPGGSAEGAFPYQGSFIFNRKVTSGTGAGFYFTPATARNMTGKVLIIKTEVTDRGGLQPTNGITGRFGSGTNAYHSIVMAGTNGKIPAVQRYRAVGGLLVIAVDLNIAGYRDSTSGSPVLTATDYFGFLAAFTTSTAKSENFGVDAIDIFGGFTLTGGGGADPAGNWPDFAQFDEVDDITRRIGAARFDDNGNPTELGPRFIGDGTTPTVFAGSGVVNWLDSLFDSGWTGARINLASGDTGTDTAVHVSGGSLDVADTRATYEITSAGAGYTLSGSLVNHASLTLAANATFTGAAEIDTLNQTGGAVDGARITATGTGGSLLTDPDLSLLNDVRITQGGTGHALRFTTPGVFPISASFTGFNAATGDNLTPNSGPTDAAIFNDSGGLLEISPVGSVSVRNGPGATTKIVNSVTVSVTAVDASAAPIEGARVYLFAATGGPDTPGTVYINALTDAAGQVSVNLNFSGDQPITGRIRRGSVPPLYKTAPLAGVITQSGLSLTSQLISDQ